MWILSKYKDIFLLSFSGVFMFFFFSLFHYNHISEMFYLFILPILFYIDIFHVYLTLPRMQLDFNKSKYFFIIVPIISFFILFIFQINNLNSLWILFFYFAIFHFIKQNYGIMRWYLSLNNKREDRFLDHYAFLLPFIPFVCLHFDISKPELFFVSSLNSIVNIPNLELYNIFVIINIFTISSWFIYELKLIFIDKTKEYGRFIFMLSNAILYNLVVFIYMSPLIMLMTFLFNHGFQYILINLKLFKEFYKLNNKSIIIICIIPVILAFCEFAVKELVTLDVDYIEPNKDFLTILIISLIWTPLLSHYIIDFKIWTNKYFKELKK